MGGPRDAFVYLFLGIMGLCVGSFLNVVAYRLPRECMSVTRPRSRCPRCATPIAWFDNLPVLSWLLLRGKCRECGLGVSARYPLIELATGLIFVLLAWLVELPAEVIEPASAAAAWTRYGLAALITSALIALSLIDLDYRILPDQITKTGILVGPVLVAIAPELQPSAVIAIPGFAEPWWQAMGNGVVGALVAGGTLWLIGWLGTKAFKKDAMGFGDVKMIAAMGGVLGLWALLSLALAAMVGAVVGIAVLLVTRERQIPFGPFLALGMWLVMLRGEEILKFWLSLFR